MQGQEWVYEEQGVTPFTNTYGKRAIQVLLGSFELKYPSTVPFRSTIPALCFLTCPNIYMVSLRTQVKQRKFSIWGDAELRCKGIIVRGLERIRSFVKETRPVPMLTLRV
jgi:hypothetical protein